MDWFSYISQQKVKGERRGFLTVFDEEHFTEKVS
jgi:hypothetical protein